MSKGQNYLGGQAPQVPFLVARYARSILFRRTNVSLIPSSLLDITVCRKTFLVISQLYVQ